MGVWSPERVRATQCELSVMIFPEMFNNFVLENLKSTYAYVDHEIYHLYGESKSGILTHYF